MNERTCVVDGCDKPPRTAKADWCRMHYHRWYRHGTTEASARNVRTGPGRRYVMAEAKGHPLANKWGWIYAHRKVLYGLLGEGDHPCHWCGVMLAWRGDRIMPPLQVDHLNAIGDDNRPENLVAACPSCNTTRAHQARHQELLRLGYWSRNDTVARTGTGRLPIISTPLADTATG